MSSSSFILRSCLKTAFMRRSLFRGLCWSLPGLFSLTYGGIFFPPSFLESKGALLFFGSGALISYGLIPYRKMRRLAEVPAEILLEKDFFSFRERGKRSLSFPYKAIESLEYVETKSRYGIGLTFKKKSLENKRVLKRKKGFFSSKYDFFFPYFTPYSLQILAERLNGEEETTDF